LLLAYRDLGIEIHDAYGLTEAPLVTINHLGKNRIGTVGQPLPETKLKQRNDGELLIKGPQVMNGYLNEEKNRTIKNGWLYTGDLAKITKDRDLIIYDRKKDMIATSYGKMISTLKIESMLKNIEGIDETMLIGERKPFLSVLIWSNSTNKINLAKTIENGIKQINNNLSHAEQIRTWAILKNDLKVENGDLTPNLKLKRHNINSRFEKVIESLYNLKTVDDPRILNIGRTKI
jgi:long-chain acyl-CoA synthetase